MTSQRLPPRNASSRPARLPILARLWLSCGVVTLCGGCGYQQSGSMGNAAAGYEWSSLYRTDVKTVAVPIFTNKTFHRALISITSDRRNLEAQRPICGPPTFRHNAGR